MLTIKNRAERARVVDNISQLIDRNQLRNSEKGTIAQQACPLVFEKYLSKSTLERIAFKNAASALCIKLILCTGITYNVARNIKLSDFNDKYGILSIKGYRVTLPLFLASQMKSYTSLMKRHDFENAPTFLFFGIDGNQWGKATTSSGIPNFLRIQLNEDELDDEVNSGVTHLVKYGIKQLIEHDVNDAIISDLTGASHGFIRTCYGPSKESEEGYSYLNSRLLKLSSID